MVKTGKKHTYKLRPDVLSQISYIPTHSSLNDLTAAKVGNRVGKEKTSIKNFKIKLEKKIKTQIKTQNKKIK